jgi:repressor of nif and glnA expression
MFNDIKENLTELLHNPTEARILEILYRKPEFSTFREIYDYFTREYEKCPENVFRNRLTRLERMGLAERNHTKKTIIRISERGRKVFAEYAMRKINEEK